MGKSKCCHVFTHFWKDHQKREKYVPGFQKRSSESQRGVKGWWSSHYLCTHSSHCSFTFFQRKLLIDLSGTRQVGIIHILLNSTLRHRELDDLPKVTYVVTEKFRVKIQALSFCYQYVFVFIFLSFLLSLVIGKWWKFYMLNFKWVNLILYLQ